MKEGWAKLISKSGTSRRWKKSPSAFRDDPFVETPSHPKKLGKFLLLLAVQDEQRALPEKMTLRKYNVTFNANYVEKQEHPNTDSWMLVTNVVIDKAVQEKIKEKRTVQIQEQHPRGAPENQFPRLYEQDKYEFKTMLSQVLFEAQMSLPGPQQSPLQPRVLAPQ